MTRDELIEIIEQHVEVVEDYELDMETGDTNIVYRTDGTGNAADAILARLENPFGKYSDPGISDDCEFCAGDGNCPSRSDGWRCTRELGHTGSHVACGGKELHSVKTWPNMQDKP